MGRIIFFVVILMTGVVNAEDRIDKRKVDRGIAIASELVELRSSLAQTYIKPKEKISEEISGKICVAVSEKARTVAKDEGYVIKFVATKFRNSDNKADDEQKHTLKLFNDQPLLKENFYWASIGEKDYYVYMKPVYAEGPCLACHGEAKKRPEFIKKKYPADKSSGFREGDIMGAVAVFTEVRQ